jgi:hypothetical protein
VRFDLAAALGSPSDPITYRFIIPAGSVVGGNNRTFPAVDASGLHVDSTGYWFIDGDILGIGGYGADAFPITEWVGLPTPGLKPYVEADLGAGGGGAGYWVGAGGALYHNAPAGTNGNAATGGAGGTTYDHPFETDPVEAGAQSAPLIGGDAVWLNHAATIELVGDIGGGGGGGSHGRICAEGYAPGGAGGDLGQAGKDGYVTLGWTPIDTVFGFPLNGLTIYSPAAAGYAIRYSGSGNATINGSGSTYGTVG